MKTLIEEVSFVEFDHRFLQQSFFWLTDPEIKKLTDTPDISRDRQEQWFRSLPAKKDYYIRGILVGNEPIGAVGIKNITDSEGEYWGYIGEKNFWGHGIGNLMVGEMIGVAIRKYTLKEIYLKVAIQNLRAIALYKRIGFTVQNTDERFHYMRYQLRRQEKCDCF